VREEIAATKTKVAKSTVIGKVLAQKAIEKNITTVVFDPERLFVSWTP